MHASIARGHGITAVFWGDNIVAAWDADGEYVNLWFAYAWLVATRR